MFYMYFDFWRKFTPELPKVNLIIEYPQIHTDPWEAELIGSYFIDTHI